VESRNPLYLAWLADRQILTSYMVSPNERKYSAFVFWANLYIMKWSYTWGPFDAMSMNDRRYTRTVADALGPDLSIYVSTVNDADDFVRYAEIPQVRIVLTGRDFYSFDSCVTPLNTQAPPAAARR
jgi:hypothetical protein